MDIIEINKNEKNKIKELIQYSRNIEFLNNQMCELEINGLKNSDRYEKLLNSFKLINILENKIYKSLSFSRFNDLIKYVKSFIKFKQNEKYERFIFGNAKDNDIIRVLNILRNIESKRYINPTTKNKNCNDQKIVKAKIMNAIEVDFFNCFLYFIQESINKSDNVNIENNLIRAKYNIIYQNKDIENMLISNNFEIPSDLYLSSEFVSKFFNYNMKEFYELKNKWSSDIATVQIFKLIEISDKDLEKLPINLRVIIRNCLLKAALMVINDDNIADVNYVFHELVDNKKFKEKYPNVNLSIKMVINSFNSMRKNKSVPTTLTFKSIKRK